MENENDVTPGEFRENYEILLQLVERRKEMVQLLKIAQPENVPKIQKAIADIDETIERTEKIMALERELFLERQKADKQWTELRDLADKIEPGLRAYVAEHHSEKLELLDAMLSDDDKTH
jgi:hypothetical protein